MSDHIPFEVQVEIMKRLPTKSLMQFRSVSKPWKSLIDSPEFITDYSFNHTHEQHLLVTYPLPYTAHRQKYVCVVGDDTFPEEQFPLPTPILELTSPFILGSSQGLFALYGYSGGPRVLGRVMKAVVLWNPSIRKSVAIDVPDVANSFSHIVIGFGVCPHTRDPKLLKIDSSYTRSVDTISFNAWKVEVYTLSSGAWRSIPTINQPRKSIDLLWEQVNINEFIYWLAIDVVDTHMTTFEFQGYNVIVSFDMTNEGFMEVSLPDTLACAPKGNVVISKLKESLVVVEVVKEVDKLVYGVWMMEHGVPNSFTKLYTISSQDASKEAVLGFWKNNEPIIKMRTDYDLNDEYAQDVCAVVGPELDGIFVQKLRSGDIRYIAIYGKGTSYCARSYMETLLLLNH